MQVLPRPTKKHPLLGHQTRENKISTKAPQAADSLVLIQLRSGTLNLPHSQYSPKNWSVNFFPVHGGRASWWCRLLPEPFACGRYCRRRRGTKDSGAAALVLPTTWLVPNRLSAGMLTSPLLAAPLVTVHWAAAIPITCISSMLYISWCRTDASRSSSPHRLVQFFEPP